MMTSAVRLEDVSKRYGGGGPRYATLRDELSHLGRAAVAALRGRRLEGTGQLALDHVSFEVSPGEAFAIIGPNGAGKTTALKLITRITYPTSGRVRVRGRIGALIDVGAGLHPELTGRENIWLYGRIMGMSRTQIARKFEEIVEFAEISQALDRPVKMYSSGMHLRLGFSVASHLDPDIFVVDEALAVGDAGFQAKCVERMARLITEGRTLLFVSHNLSAVEAVCRRGLFMLDGRVQMLGTAREALAAYLDWVDTVQAKRLGESLSIRTSDGLDIKAISFHDAQGLERAVFRTGEEVEIRLHLSARRPIDGPIFSLGISDGRPGNLILCSMLVDGQVLPRLEGEHTVACRIRALPLLPRVYQLWCSVRSRHAYGDLMDFQPVAAFRVAEGPPGANGPAALSHLGTDAPIYAEYEWRW